MRDALYRFDGVVRNRGGEPERGPWWIIAGTRESALAKWQRAVMKVRRDSLYRPYPGDKVCLRIMRVVDAQALIQ